MTQSEELEHLRRQVTEMKKRHVEMKHLRCRLAMHKRDLVYLNDVIDRVERHLDRFRTAITKIAELEPELITAPQIIGYAKRVLEKDGA